VEFSPTGAATVISATGKTPAGNLPGRDLDLLFVALRLTLAEKAAARVKAPLIIEGIPPGIEEAKTGLLGRMLKHLGTHTQVLHVTGHPSFATLSDLTVGL
jgi:DNA repair ATPase RecN